MINNPFKFLESYDKDDKDRFFGRGKETAQLFNAIHASSLVLLYGASGTGKTSLVNCGLANKFQTTDWLPIFIRRGSDLNQSLLREIDRNSSNQWAADTALRHRIKDLYLETYRPVYLIFDQFEELYIMGTKEEQDQFHQTISQFLQAGLQCKVLLIIREEYIAYLNEFEKVVPPLFDNRLRIEKMNDLNLSKVVLGTCRYGGIEVKEARKTVGAILDNLRNPREGIDLTNLQVYLDRLWRRDLDRQGVFDSAQTPYDSAQTPYDSAGTERSRSPGSTQIEAVVFDPPLVEAVGPMQNVLSDFLDEQMVEIEAGLRNRGVKKPEGLPLEVLFTLVTEDGTKRNRDPEAIISDLPKNRQLSESNLAFCLSEFERIKLLRRFAEE